MALRDFALAKSADVVDGDGSAISVAALRHEEPGVPADDGTVGPAGRVPERNSSAAEPRGGPLRGAISVLVVEDDETHAIALRTGLEREGFAVTCARDGASGLELLHSTAPDVVIVDAMLPGLTGIDVCRRLRESGSTVPVIVVSASSEELDVVLAMEIGADDFLAKPYRMRELVARIRAVLRRSSPRRAGVAVRTAPAMPVAEEASPRVLVVDDVLLDSDRHEVYVHGRRVELTGQEFRLLEELLRRAGLLLLRQTLLERIWGSDFDGNGKILSTLINRLRARIEDDPDSPARIVTIRGLGYRYDRQRHDEQSGERHGAGSTGHGFARPHHGDHKMLLASGEVGTPVGERGLRAWE